MARLPVVRSDGASSISTKVTSGRALMRAGARFSITARKDRADTAATIRIPDDGWTTIGYPIAVFDEQVGRLISDAGAEMGFTAVTSRRLAEHARQTRKPITAAPDRCPVPGHPRRSSAMNWGGCGLSTITGWTPSALL